MLAFDQKACRTNQFSLTDQFYDCFICDESHGLQVNTKLLVKSFILALDQTACQTDHFSLTDQFYDCFVCDKIRGLLEYMYVYVCVILI